MAKGSLTMQGMVAMAIGVMALVVVFIVIPLVGSQMDQVGGTGLIPGYTINATEGTPARGSAWNATLHTDVPTGVSLWTSVAGIIKVGAILVIIGGFLRTLQGLRS